MPAYPKILLDGWAETTISSSNTKCFRFRNGDVSFEIAVAGPMLFEGFGLDDRRIAACGIECSSRLDALERVFEHELVHLREELDAMAAKGSLTPELRVLRRDLAAAVPAAAAPASESDAVKGASA